MEARAEPAATVLIKKQDVIDMMGDLPDEFDPEELMYRLYVREKLARSEAALAAGDVYTEEEVERLSEEWLA